MAFGLIPVGTTIDGSLIWNSGSPILVAGDLVHLEDRFRTKSGRDVRLRIYVEPGDGELPTTGPSGPVAPALVAALGLVAAGSIAVMSSRRRHNRNAGKDTHRNKRVGSATSAVGARAATVSEIPFPGASQR